jgi:hypothetical protein
MRGTPYKKRELHCKTCEDVSSNQLISTFSIVSHNVQVCNGRYKEMEALNTTTHHEKHEKMSAVENQLFAVPSLNHHNERGRNPEIHSIVLTPSPNLKGNQNNSDLNLQYKLVSNCDDTLVSIRNEHTQSGCADLFDPHVHTCAKHLQIDNHCSIMHDCCYALTNICATLHANQVDHMKLITHAEIFTKTSPTKFMFYVKLDEFVKINKIIKSVLDISSMKSLNSVYSCKFTFNFIGHQVVNQFYVCAL